jgi:hypothetical protein
MGVSKHRPERGEDVNLLLQKKERDGVGVKKKGTHNTHTKQKLHFFWFKGTWTS